MSATSHVAGQGLPGPNSSPGLSAANVTVRVAASTAPGAAPVSPSTPLGMSTASTPACADVGRRPRPAALVAGAKPVP